MKTVLITGAFGNLGLMCVDQALAQGHRVHCFDIENANTKKLAAQYADKVDVFLGDIRDQALLAKALQGVDAIIHNASLLPPLTDTQPALAHEINVVATQKMIALAEQLEKKPVFIFPSSFTVFGAVPEKGRIYTAADPVEPSDNYTEHKVTIENTLKESSLDWVIVRIGVSVDARTLKTDRATFSKLLRVSADNPMEYVHPKDVALAMCNAVSQEKAIGKILLLGGGKNCQIDQHQFLSIAFSAFGLKLPISVHGNESFYTRWLDTEESQRLLQFQQHTIEDYREEMFQQVRKIRLFVKPLSPLINPLLPFVLKRL